MSGSPDDEEIENLRQEKMEQLRERQQQQGGGDPEAAQQAAQEREAQKKAVLRQHLTDGARQRLNTVKMSKPEFGEQVEQQVVALAQSGRLGDRIDEEQMKELLKELQPDDDGYNIRRR